MHVENCAIQGFTNAGFCVSGTANSSITTFVKDTVMRNSQINRVDMGKAVFENCRFENDSEGWEVNAKVTLHNCVLAGNPFDGLLCAGGQTMVDNCQIFDNGTGIDGLSSQVRVSNSSITNNTTGLFVFFGATILLRILNSVATNTVEDNGTNGAFTGVYSAK